MDALHALGDPGAGVARLVHGTTVGHEPAAGARPARASCCARPPGTTDVLHLRRQDRASLYDLSAHHPAPLVARDATVAVAERMAPDGVVQRARSRRDRDDRRRRACARTGSRRDLAAARVRARRARARAERCADGRASGRRRRAIERGASGDPRVRAHVDDRRGGVRAAARARATWSVSASDCAERRLPGARRDDVGRRHAHGERGGARCGVARALRPGRRRRRRGGGAARARAAARAHDRHRRHQRRRRTHPRRRAARRGGRRRSPACRSRCRACSSRRCRPAAGASAGSTTAARCASARAARAPSRGPRRSDAAARMRPSPTRTSCSATWAPSV